MKLSVILVLCLFCCKYVIGQENEIQAFKQNKLKVFNSKGHPKNRGLIFTLKYPFNYSMEEHQNDNIIMQFVDNKYHQLIYNVGVVKADNVIPIESQKIILSKSNLQTSTKSISKDAVFFRYKNNITVNGQNASYIEYISSITPESKAIIRQYFIIFKNFLLTISFTVPIHNSLNQTKRKFQSFYPFFENITNTLSIGL